MTRKCHYHTLQTNPRHSKDDKQTKLRNSKDETQTNPLHSKDESQNTNSHMSSRRHRGSYMSAHVLMNLLYELGKSDKMLSKPRILFLFRNEFNKFNNTRARMLDSIYHMTNALKSHFWCKNVIILSLLWTS